MPILLFNRQLRPRSKRRRKRQSSHTLFRNAQEVWNRRNQSRRRKNYEDYVLIGLSGLSVGQTIVVPGDDITTAVKRYWRHGLFSDVQILAEKIVGDKIYLKIILAQRPRIADIRYHGVKKSEREDLEAKLGLVKGSQITPNLIDRAKY